MTPHGQSNGFSLLGDILWDFPNLSKTFDFCYESVLDFLTKETSQECLAHPKGGIFSFEYVVKILLWLHPEGDPNPIQHKSKTFKSLGISNNPSQFQRNR